MFNRTIIKFSSSKVWNNALSQFVFLFLFALVMMNAPLYVVCEANVIGTKQTKGYSLNIIPWLDFPSSKSSALEEWRGVPENPVLAVVSYNGSQVTFEDNNFFMIMAGTRFDYQGSLCRSTLLKLKKGVNFPATTGDIIAVADGAWIRLLHGGTAGGENVKITFASDSKRQEEEIEFSLPKTEQVVIYLNMLQSKNSNARQAGALALRWTKFGKENGQVIKVLRERLLDPAPGVRGAAAWTLGELRIKEVLGALKGAFNVEKTAEVRETLKNAVAKMK